MTEELYPHCPNPECVFGKAHDRSPALELIESNVSGSGVDTMFCPTCHREYYVHYKIAKIERMDPDTGEVMK
jgi:hypothetical protein